MDLVSYDEARQYCAARTLINSNFGRQLERLRNGERAGTYDVYGLQAREEMRRLRAAKIIRCMDALVARREIKFAWCPSLRGFARKARLPEGEVAVRVLYAFEPWHPSWPEKGLADAYTWLRSANDDLAELVLENGSAAQAFRMGKCPRARKLASAIVADAHVILAEWVRIYNKHMMREELRRGGPKHAA